MYSYNFKHESFKLIYIDTVELHNFYNTTGEGFTHSNDFWEIGLVVRGSGMYGLNGKMYEITSGDIIITAPDDIHFECGSKSGGVEILFLLFSSAFSPDTSFHLPFSSSRTINGKNIPEVRQIFKNILIETLERKDGYENMIEAELIKLFILISRKEAKESTVSVYPESFPELLDIRKLKLAAEIKKYMEDNVGENLNISDIARSFYISPQHLARIFKEATNMTPKEYEKNLRINKAKQLLIDTDEDICFIAEKLGYSDIHYFYRAFKQTTSLTPMQYRGMKK